MKKIEDEIFRKVSSCIVGALGVDEDEIKPNATLRGDLGTESIDFLDIIFRLEQEFRIKIPRGELFPEYIFEGHPEYIKDGIVTKKGIAYITIRLAKQNP